MDEATIEEPGIGHNWRPWAEVRPDDNELTFEPELLEAVLSARTERYADRIAEIKAQCEIVPDEILLDDLETLDHASKIHTAADRLWKEIEQARKAALGQIDAIHDFVHGYYKRRQDEVADGQSTLQKGSPDRTVMIPALGKKIAANRLAQLAKERAEREAEAIEREAEARRQREEADRLRREEDAARQSAARKRNEELRIAADAEAKRLEAARIGAERVAHQGQSEAMVARQAAEAKPADMTRFRNTYGGTVTLAASWKVDTSTIHRPTIDLEALRMHLTFNCLEMAINALAKSGVHQIRGATIREIQKVRK